MNQPITIELESDTKTVDTTVQIYYRVQAKEKRTQLDRLLKVEQPEGCLIFCNTRYEVDRVHTFLSKKRYFVSSLHGANSQSSRMKTLDKIKRGVIQIVVATDVAARGLHIDNLGLVVNYDVPLEKDGYVHRIGRTGRAGEIGKAITLVTSEDIMTLYEIEEHIGVLIREEQLPSDAEVQKKISEATGKWANKKAPIQNHQIAKKYNQGTRKPHQHHINKSKRVQDRPAAKKQYQKNVVDRSSKTNIAAEKTHCVEKSAKKEYKPIINKRYNKNNAVYRVKTESTNRRKKEKMVKKNSLMKKIGNLMKGN